MQFRIGGAFMKIRKLICYSDSLLKGRRMKALLVSLMPVSAELLFRFAEAALYSLLLYFGGISPLGLFTGESVLQQLAALLCTVWRWLTVSPLIYASAYWFSGLSGERDKSSLSELILSRKVFRRSLAALLWTKLAGLLALVPVFLFGGAAYLLASEGEGSIHVLMAVHASVLTAISVFLWLRVKLTMLAVPFLMVHYSDSSAFAAVRSSFRFMRGRRGVLFRLLLIYLLPMLTVVGIPFLLPGLFSAAAVLVDISVKEDEYLERNKADSRVGQAADAPKLPSRKKRRLSQAPDKAQTAGYGRNT